MKKKLSISLIVTRLVPGIIFIVIGLDSVLKHLDDSPYKTGISFLAIIGGAGLLIEGIFMKKQSD